MSETNLFTMLSAYRPGSSATPFEAYCTSGLAYLLGRGHRMLTALLGQAAGAYNEPLAITEVQCDVAGGGIADLILTFEGGRRALIEVQVEPAADLRAVDALAEASRSWTDPPALLLLTLPGEPGLAGWTTVSWLEVAEALDRDPDAVAQEFGEFVLRDILGLGDVPLEQALATNRLYALGGAAVRRRFGDRARYVNSASRPLGGRYRYLGTTFSVDGGEMEYWVGVVNETVPLGEHYQLMLASRTRAVDAPSDHPRATGDWKWGHWTGVGRVVRPITPDAVDALLRRVRGDAGRLNQ